MTFSNKIVKLAESDEDYFAALIRNLERQVPAQLKKLYGKETTMPIDIRRGDSKPTVSSWDISLEDSYRDTTSKNTLYIRLIPRCVEVELVTRQESFYARGNYFEGNIRTDSVEVLEAIEKALKQWMM